MSRVGAPDPSGGLRWVQVAHAVAPWDEIESHPEASVFHSRAWSRFLARSQRVEPIVARLDRDGEPVGWFVGARARRVGLGVLGSPLPGWTTSYTGFCLDDGVDRVGALLALRRWAFGPLRCVHLEVMDRRFDASVASSAVGFRCSEFHSFEVDLVDDAPMLAAMSQGARRNIRLAERNGIRIEQVDPVDDPGFAEEYFTQALHSFGRRGTVPTYGVQRVRDVIDAVHPGGHLLLLRAVTAEGRSASTGIYCGLPGRTAFYWMGASDPDLLGLRPNEALMWHAMRTWRDRGATVLDLGGGGTFKPKFGARPVTVPWVRCSRPAALESARGLVGSALVRVRRRRAGAGASVRPDSQGPT